MLKEEAGGIKHYRKARFVRSKGEKGSYVLFYVWDAQKNGLVRKRIFVPSKYKTAEEKKAFAKERVKQINKLLASGFHPDARKSKLVEAGKSRRGRDVRGYLVSEAMSKVMSLIEEGGDYYDKGLRFELLRRPYLQGP